MPDTEEKNFIEFVNKFHVKEPTPQSLWKSLEVALDNLQDRVTEGDPLRIALAHGAADNVFGHLVCVIRGRHNTQKTNWDYTGEENDSDGQCDWCNGY